MERLKNPQMVFILVRSYSIGSLNEEHSTEANTLLLQRDFCAKFGSEQPERRRAARDVYSENVLRQHRELGMFLIRH